jgi:hypothetical protein
VQAYNYRLCLTNNSNNRIPFLPPPDYNPAATEVLRRSFLANADRLSNATLLSLFLIRHLGESKIDVNDKEGFLPNMADLPFLQAAYPFANWTSRAAIAARHQWYTRAAWEFLRTDPVVPQQIRREAQEWGLPADEFLDTGGFPPQLYVREAARLRGEVVLTQADVHGAPVSRPSDTSVGLSKWLVDIHSVLSMAAPPSSTGRGWEFTATGGVNTVRTDWQLTEIPYGALLPRRGETSNLLVPVCASFTHVAFSTYRLEPQYAVFGHSAGVAAVFAARGGTAVQDVGVAGLQRELRRQGQLLHASYPPPPPSPTESALYLAPCVQGAPQWSYLSTDGSIRLILGGGSCVSVWGYSNSTGEKLVTAECHTDFAPHNQAWDLVTVPGVAGSVVLRSRMSGLCAVHLGTVILQGACEDSAARFLRLATAPAAALWVPTEGNNLCVSIH